MKKVLGSLLATLFLVACAKTEPAYPPLVEGIKQTTQFNALLPNGQNEVVTEVTLRKGALFGRTFLYGATLQSSSVKDGEISVTLMAMALGQIPVEFKIVDDRLRLVSDARLNFESDVNHPSRIIHEFKILKQSEETITIRAKGASPVLETFLFDAKKDGEKRLSAIRTLEYAEQDELFLIESTLEMVNGSVAEVMETITPRDRIVPEGTKVIFDDAELNPDSNRFGFISPSEKVFINVPEKGRVKTAAAQRFLVKNNEPIKWYVSRNAPDAYMNDIKNGVEGWNRYSQALYGRDLVRFEGRLPEGAKIGDIRYNVIVWDQVAEAGAAYETQGSDPFTGVQTHSLIYLPAAWVNIGKEYWKSASRTEEKVEARLRDLRAITASRKFAGRSLPVNCLEGAHMHVNLDSKATPEEFGRELLRGTLFHEVGHALGLAHNFKGSLSFDADTGTGFSTSIMDYNHFNEESSAFDSIDTSTGPLLEYDRQMIAVLYGEGVKESDPTLPSCDDSEADSNTGGVDPLCLRYDIGKDPTKQAVRAVDLIRDAQVRSGKLSSLPVALSRAVKELPDAATITTLDEAKKAVTALVTSVAGTTNLYVGGTANSIANLGSLALKSLYVAREGTILEGYNEEEMRERALNVLETVMATDSLPQATKASLAEIRAALETYLRSAPAFSAGGEQEQKGIAELLKAVDDNFAKAEQTVLTKARTKLIGAVKYNADAPLAFHNRGGEAIDLEAKVVELLEQATGPKAGAADRPAAERTAAITTLLTFKGVTAGAAAIERVKANLESEIAASRDARQREVLRKLRAALN